MTAADTLAALPGVPDALLADALRVAEVLGIAPRIAAGEVQAAALAAATGSEPDALARLLRYLTAFGVLREPQDGRFELAELGERLRWDPPATAPPPIGQEDRSARNLLHCVRTGRPSPDAMSLWDGTAADPGTAALFGVFMEAQALQLGAELAGHCEWGGVGRFVDVGGGSAGLACSLLRSVPGLRGAVVDRGETARLARTAVESSGLTSRCDVVDGSFFDPLPAGADRYLLCRVLHDWPDEDAVRILRRCRDAAAPRGRVLVVEQPLARTRESLSLDLLMLCLGAGRERTVAQQAGLAAAAGLRMRSETPLPSGFVVVEHVAA